MKHLNMDQVLSRIKLAQDDQEITADIKNLVGDPTKNVTPKNNNSNTDDSDNDDDSEDDDSENDDADDSNTDEDDADDSNTDEDDDDDTVDPGDALKTFPSTDATKSIYDGLQNYGTQAYIVAEIVNQIEGFKAAGNTASMNKAITALRSALADMQTMQKNSTDALTAYLKPFAGK